MSSSDLRKDRFRKLKRIRNLNNNPYPAETKRTHSIEEALSVFGKLSKSKKEIFLAGRIYSIRKHGGMTFIHFGDGTGKIQAYFAKDKIGPKAYKEFLDNFDTGDFIEIKGILFKTKRGEKTIEARDFKMLAKSLLPLPEKWHGLKDLESRLRKRYLDLIFNPEIRDKFERKSEIIKELRRFLDSKGFLEVETPILQPIYGGASAKPFKTQLNALNMDLYLRISPELYLKRLIVGGFNKVYEIGKCFRNEGIDKSHNPDFTMLEFYWAYNNYKDLMKLTEEMFVSLVGNIFKGKKISYDGKSIDFKTPFPRIEFGQLLRKETGIDFDSIHLKAIEKKAKELKINIEKGDSKFQIADKIYKKHCLPKIWKPTFVINHPTEGFPLAKPLEKSPKKAETFQLIVAGWELVKAYSELNDPIKQKDNFKEEEKLFKGGSGESQRMDKDYIEALEHGMPPAAGFGLGIDRLVVLLTDSRNLREVILFPTMRKE